MKRDELKKALLDLHPAIAAQFIDGRTREDHPLLVTEYGKPSGTAQVLAAEALELVWRALRDWCEDAPEPGGFDHGAS